MKKFIFCLLCLCILPFPLLAGDSNSAPKPNGQADKTVRTGFRWAHWGDDKEAVKKTEPGELISETRSTMTFRDEVLFCAVHIVYYFGEDDKLFKGKYIPLGETIEQQYSFFSLLHHYLEKKYGHGQNAYSEERIPNLLEIANGANAAFIWKLGDTGIRHQMSGQNGTIHVAIEYISEDLAKKTSEMRMRRFLDGL